MVEARLRREVGPRILTRRYAPGPAHADFFAFQAGRMVGPVA